MKYEIDPFGKVIFAYTRKQALADGFQVDVTETAKEAGIRFPTFLTRAVFEAYVQVPPGVDCQDETGRLWDIVSMLRFAIKHSATATNPVTVQLHVKNDQAVAQLVKLLAACGPMDMDDPQPAITVMMPNED